MATPISRHTFLRQLAGGAASVAGMGMSSSTLGESPKSIVISFAGATPGALPADFVPALTGGGGPVVWQIVEDASVPARRVLAQTSTDRTDARFPICIYERVRARDVDVSVRFKPVAGKVDQAGGLIVRVSDKDNYYVVRANALEDNVRLYHVIGGRRSQFAGANTKVRSGDWQTLRLRVEGARFQVHFEGKMLFEASDSRLAGASRIGLWTKADSVTAFDDLAVTPQ